MNFLQSIGCGNNPLGCGHVSTAGAGVVVVVVVVVGGAVTTDDLAALIGENIQNSY